MLSKEVAIIIEALLCKMCFLLNSTVSIFKIPRYHNNLSRLSQDQYIINNKRLSKTMYNLLCLVFFTQAAKEKQKIRSEEIQIEVVERRKQIEVQEKEIMRKERELIAKVKRPAEAESFKVETLAQGRR